MISIIIPTYNEEKYPPKLLDTIKGQTYKNYEVIVADANSKDKTKEIAKEYGYKVVNGVLDANVQLPRDFLLKAINEFKSRDIGALGTSFIPNENNFIYRLFSYITQIGFFIGQFFSPLAAYAIMVSKEMHDKIGGFIEKPIMGKDHLYVKKHKIKKVRVLKNPKIIASMRRFESEGILSVLKNICLLRFIRRY